MLYRVVMQGRTLGGADSAVVKREFVRVTGLPVRVADDMFSGMPNVIKRRVEQADAERIAATLRAIGAAATVEREIGTPDAGDATHEGIEIIAAPLGNGPPTVAPGMAPPEPAPPPRQKTWVRQVCAKWPLAFGTLALVGAVAYFADEVSGWVSSFRPAPVAATPKSSGRAASAEPAPAAVTLNPTLLHGPWRCVDQRTGLGAYWSYAVDGALVFHGDVLSDRPAATAASAATGWKIEGAKLVHRHAQGETEAYNVSQLTLSRLRYAGERGLEIECRRP